MKALLLCAAKKHVIIQSRLFLHVFKHVWRGALNYRFDIYREPLSFIINASAGTRACAVLGKLFRSFTYVNTAM